MNEEGLDNPQSTSPVKHSETLVPEPLSAPETESIISKAYEIAGPRIGSRLVEANNVLTIAGARGQTEFFITDPTENDVERIKLLDESFKNKRISIYPVGKPFKSPRGINMLMVNIESLQGYERVSKMTKMPGFTPFESNLGWDGFEMWKHKTLQSIKDLQATGKTSFSAEYISDVMGGVVKGYPDIAIYDLIAWVASDRKIPILDSQVPYVSLYGGAEPNFDYSPEHKNDPTITDTVNGWGKLLGDFYKTPWHKQISIDPQFIEARKSNAKK